MKPIYIREGETYEATFTDTDLSAQTVSMTITNQDKSVRVVGTANYATQVIRKKDMAVATISITDPSLVEGDYQYMYTIVYEGKVVKLPDASGCKSGCPLPSFIVCEANDTEA